MKKLIKTEIVKDSMGITYERTLWSDDSVEYLSASGLVTLLDRFIRLESEYNEIDGIKINC